MLSKQLTEEAAKSEASACPDSPSREMLEHWAVIADEYQRCQEFLNWLEDEYSIRLDYDYVPETKPAPMDRLALLDQFFKLDRRKLEAERRQLMKSMG